MEVDTLKNFIHDLYFDISLTIDQIHSTDDDQYRLGIRRIAKIFFDKFELFELNEVFPDLPYKDVDAWFSGNEPRI
jgi:hypothetical protein